MRIILSCCKSDQIVVSNFACVLYDICNAPFSSAVQHIHDNNTPAVKVWLKSITF